MAHESDVTAIDPAQTVFQVATGYMLSAALNVVLELDIAGRLAAGPAAVADLARETGANEGALYRVLRALASVGIFEEIGSRRFALTPAAAALRQGPGSLHALARFLTDPFHFQLYANLSTSVRTGRPAMEATVGAPAFEYFRQHPEYSAVFNDAMTAFSAAVIPAVVDTYDFAGIDLLVDIGGGHGEVLLTILRKYPKMHGIVADLDHVVQGTRPRIKAAGLDDRCDAVAVDFFASVPRGDAYIMKHIIHDWDDDHALTILRNIHEAIGSTRGKVLLVESVIPPGNEPSLGKLIDLEMLLFPGGIERTAEEFRSLFDRAGFELTNIVPNHSPLAVVEARKKS
jgi:hypothetical protein